MIDPVLCRRSIRKFKKNPIDNAQVKRLLTAAMCAPSAEDERPWHFIVVRDNPVKNDLAEAWPLAHIVNDAAVAIVVCGDESLQKVQNCWMLDCAAATENLLVEAQYIGLGAVWLGLYPVEGRIQRVRDILGAPRSVIPFSIIPIGIPDESKEPLSRYDERKIHNQKW